LILLTLDYIKSLKRRVPKQITKQVIIQRLLDAISYIASNCLAHLLTAVACPV